MEIPVGDGSRNRSQVNTVKTRTHSLLFQGAHYYQAIPMMKEKNLTPLIAAFAELLREQRVLRDVFGLI